MERRAMRKRRVSPRGEKREGKKEDDEDRGIAINGGDESFFDLDEDEEERVVIGVIFY